MHDAVVVNMANGIDIGQLQLYRVSWARLSGNSIKTRSREQVQLAECSERKVRSVKRFVIENCKRMRISEGVSGMVDVSS